MQRDYILGLDLGQTTDYSALAVLERPVESPSKEVIYALRHLQRFPLGTPYTTIVPGVARIAAKPPLRGSPLVVDQTGVGRPVVDMLRRTPGLAALRSGDCWRWAACKAAAYQLNSTPALTPCAQKSVRFS